MLCRQAALPGCYRSLWLEVPLAIRLHPRPHLIPIAHPHRSGRLHLAHPCTYSLITCWHEPGKNCLPCWRARKPSEVCLCSQEPGPIQYIARQLSSGQGQGRSAALARTSTCRQRAHSPRAGTRQRRAQARARPQPSGMYTADPPQHRLEPRKTL